MIDENVTNQDSDSETKASNPYDALYENVMLSFRFLQ